MLGGRTSAVDCFFFFFFFFFKKKILGFLVVFFLYMVDGDNYKFGCELVKFGMVNLSKVVLLCDVSAIEEVV